MAPSDGQAAYDAAEALADAAGVPFVAGRSGHGWELLVDPVDGSVTRIGRRLMALATGRWRCEADDSAPPPFRFGVGVPSLSRCSGCSGGSPGHGTP